jgi:uncharacterized protein
MGRASFVVPVHDLDVTGRSVEFELTPTWLRGALEGCEMQPGPAGGTLQAHLAKTGHDILLQGQIDVSLVVPCARCLADVPWRPHIELSLLLHPADEASAGPDAFGARRVHGHKPNPKDKASDDPTEFPGDEADMDTYEGEEVVMDGFVREAILLESPIFPLCSEACEGIRPASDPQASGRPVVDPRLLPLLELSKRRTMKE